MLLQIFKDLDLGQFDSILEVANDASEAGIIDIDRIDIRIQFVSFLLREVPGGAGSRTFPWVNIKQKRLLFSDKLEKKLSTKNYDCFSINFEVL